MLMPLVNNVMGLLPINPLRILSSAGNAIAPEKAAQAAQKQDTVRFSELARLSHAAARAGVPLGEDGLNVTQLEKLRGEYLTGLQEQLGNLFQDHDIDTSQPIQLQRGYGGYLRVSNGHPQRFEIEAALEQSPEAKELFQKLEAVSNLLRAARAAGEEAGYAGSGSRGNLNGTAFPNVGTAPFTFRYADDAAKQSA